MRNLILLIMALMLCGATCKSSRQKFSAVAVEKNKEELAEQSRKATTGARDAVRLAPTNPPTNLAGKLLDRAEQIQGLPVERLDIPGILASNKQAVAELAREMRTVVELLKERPVLAATKAEADEALMVKGRLYEEQQKKNIIKRVWRWGIATFGTGGFIALCLFCPGFLLLIPRIAAWIVKALPKLAGVIGVVGTKFSDGIVVGVQSVRDKLADDKAKKLSGVKAEQVSAVIASGEPVYTATQVQAMIDIALATATSREDKLLIATRKEALAPVIAKEPEPPLVAAVPA